MTGWQTYVLGRDGRGHVNTRDGLKNSLKAFAADVCFQAHNYSLRAGVIKQREPQHFTHAQCDEFQIVALTCLCRLKTFTLDNLLEWVVADKQEMERAERLIAGKLLWSKGMSDPIFVHTAAFNDFAASIAIHFGAPGCNAQTLFDHMLDVEGNAGAVYLQTIRAKCQHEAADTIYQLMIENYKTLFHYIVRHDHANIANTTAKIEEQKKYITEDRHIRATCNALFEYLLEAVNLENELLGYIPRMNVDILDWSEKHHPTTYAWTCLLGECEYMPHDLLGFAAVLADSFKTTLDKNKSEFTNPRRYLEDYMRDFPLECEVCNEHFGSWWKAKSVIKDICGGYFDSALKQFNKKTTPILAMEVISEAWERKMSDKFAYIRQTNIPRSQLDDAYEAVKYLQSYSSFASSEQQTAIEGTAAIIERKERVSNE